MEQREIDAGGVCDACLTLLFPSPFSLLFHSFLIAVTGTLCLVYLCSCDPLNSINPHSAVKHNTSLHMLIQSLTPTLI